MLRDSILITVVLLGSQGLAICDETKSSAPASAPTYLKDLATVAFQQGRERDAIAYLYAHGLASDQGADEVIRTIQWVRGLRRPALAVRWGIGAIVKAPNDLATAKIFYPIGSFQQSAVKRGGSRRGEVAAGAGGVPGFVPLPGSPSFNSLSPAAKSLVQISGELGEKFLTSYRSRLASGAFGTTFKLTLADIEKPAAAPASIPENQYRIDSDGNRRLGDAYVLPGGDVVVSRKDFEFITGRKTTEKEPSLAAAFREANKRGFAPVKEKSPAAPSPPEASAIVKELTNRLKMSGSADRTRTNLVDVGAVFLGSGSQKELVDKANSEKLDLLLLFEVSVKKPVRGNGPVVNETKMVILNVSAAAPVYSSKSLSNVNVQQAREQSIDDGVDKEFEKLFSAVETEFVMTALPATLTPERAVLRVNSLSASMPKDPLPVLAEIKLYHLLGLIQQADLTRAFESLVGAGQGVKLAGGSFDERAAVLEPMLPK